MKFPQIVLLASVACAIVCTAPPDGLVADDLLGLPKPLDPARPGAVLLHGGGPVRDSTFRRFIELAGGKQARIVLIPCAGYPRGYYAREADYRAMLMQRFSSWVALPARGEVASFRFLYTDDPADARRPEFARVLESATGVWFSGGAQSRLNWRFVGWPQQTRFQQALRDVVARGGVVGGTSAGMAALPEVITLREQWNGTRVSAIAAHGLGVFNGAIVEQHFDGRGGRLERFLHLLRDHQRLDTLAGREGAGEKMLGIAVEERTGLAIRGDQAEVFGDGQAHLFYKTLGGRSLAWHTLRGGEQARLTRDQPDLVQGLK